MNKEELKTLIETKGKDWVIAAMIDGSIGYHTPKHANIIIDRVLAGATTDHCERCDACFGNDVLAMLDYDIQIMTRTEEHFPDKALRLVEAVKIISTWSEESQLSMSLAYPTISL